MYKKDFPIFKKQPDLIYFDNAATSQKPFQVINRIVEFYETQNANVHRGLYSLSEKATGLYEEAREEIAGFINADPNEVIFTSGTTQSLNILADMLKPELRKDESILLTDMEHHSNILPWQRIISTGKNTIGYVSLDNTFQLDMEDLKTKLKKFKVKILSLAYMSNVLGTINPIKEIIKITRKISPGTLVVIDAAQAVPHIQIDVKELDADFLVFSGHKMLAETGIGVLFGKLKHLNRLKPTVTGGGMIEKVERTRSTFQKTPWKFEAGTPNLSGALSLAEAVRYLKPKLEEITICDYKLSEYMHSKLSEINEVTIYGPANPINRGPVFSISIKNIHPHDLAQLLDESNIAIRAGHHCAQILHREVLRIPATARASLYIYNTTEEIDKFLFVLKSIISKFREK